MPKKKEDSPNQSRWQALFRGSLLSTTMNKHVSYVGLADRRAQGIITINSILIPLALSGSQNPIFMNGALVAIATALLSISTAIFSLYPKRYGHKNHAHRDLLHFSQIQRFSEERYLELMKEALEDTGLLAEMITQDLYHISQRILHPKFFWLKISYFSFFIGNLIALLLIGLKALS